ncbi:hypothetical protein R1T43_03195 [Alteromonas sp. CI.11.F.A3]|uniref:hypothetical protein n=1 Tax=Alteromonas sp. CI.11.F.A3 TaxID=3079555 RepID=UPI002941BF22|nr:hypothetical protein [Alteromonas sp. CI.11.F.A3]WOI38065.1 hypothetical protein R1T43_03195 [Alteromonas sp. CI.11.F.A3]
MKNRLFLFSIVISILQLTACSSEDKTYDLDLSISGLDSGSLTVESSLGERVSINSSGVYRFKNGFKSLDEANVSIISQPVGLLCENTQNSTQDNIKLVNIECHGAPAPSILSINYDVKKINLEWVNNSSKNMSHSILLRQRESDTFVPIKRGISSTSFELIVNSYEYASAEIIIETCNSLGCAQSEVSSVSENLIEIIGFTELDSVDENFYYGREVSVSSEANLLLVSASKKSSEVESGLEYRFGSVYLYSLTTGSPAEVEKFELPNAELDFGEGVGVSDNGHVLVILGEVVSQTDSSEKLNGIYIYEKESGGSWLLSQTIALDGLNDWHFGNAIDLTYSGNLIVLTNFKYGDSLGRTVVLERGQDDSYHFSVIEDPTSGHMSTGYGSSISVSRDGSFFIVGSPREDEKVIEIDDDEFPTFTYTEGAAFVYEKLDGEWSVTSKLKSSSPRIDEAFGTGLNISDDGQLIAVGSPGGEGSSGKVEIFVIKDGLWSQAHLLNSPSPSPYLEDRFGYSLSFNHGADGLFIGAPGEKSDLVGITKVSSQNVGSNDSGAIYHYSINSTEHWENKTLIKSKVNFRYEGFGKEVLLTESGTLIAAGFNYPAIVGERKESPGGFYIY